MKLCTKICLWLGGLLLAAGTILFVCGMSAKNWDFKTLATIGYEQKEYISESEITDVVLDFDASRIRIVCDTDAKQLTCTYPVAKELVSGKTAQVSVSEKNGVLTIAQTKPGFPPFQWNLDSPELVLTLPQSTNSLSVSADVGDIELNGLTAEGRVLLKTDVGGIVCKNVTAAEIELHTNVGSITAENCTASGALTLNGDVCDVTMKNLSAEQLSVKTNLGDITLQGTLRAVLAEFSADSGNIDLADGTTDAENLVISTALGNITSLLSGRREDYTADVVCSMGECNLSSSTGGTRSLTVRADCGNVHISFTE